MKYRFKITLLVLCFFLGTGPSLSTPAAPSLQVPSPKYEFGEIEEGQIQSHDYLIKNTGPGTLEIYDVRPG
jgi:hypothetical protein